MIENHIQDCFRKKFEGFFLENDILWHNHIFAGYKNGLLSYVFVKCEDADGKKDVDIIFFTMPDFCADKWKLNISGSYGFSLKNVAEVENIIFDTTVSHESDIDVLMSSYLQLLKERFEMYFIFDSFTDYAVRMLEFGKRNREYVTLRPMLMGKFYKMFSGVDIVEFCYYFMLESGRERCKKFTLELVGGYKILLYDRMKYSNLPELSKNFSEEYVRSFDRILANYSLLTEFFEALMEGNDSYFATVDSNFRKKCAESKLYIQSLIAE